MAGHLFVDRLQRVRANYGVTPWIEPRVDESPLLRSWERSEASGLGPDDAVTFELVRRSLLAEIDDRHASFIRRSHAEMDRLSRALRNASCSVLLVNDRAVVIDQMNDEASASKPLRAVSRKGVNLDERCVGTTAPSIVLREGTPYLVGRDAHYAASNRGFFCVAAPIDDPAGQRLGALSIVAHDAVPAFDVFSLVTHASTAIENSFFEADADRLVIHFHARPEWVGTPMEGILELDGTKRIVGINRSALRLLCTTRAAVLGTDFDALMDFALNRQLSLRNASHLSEMQSRSGLQLHARLSTAGEGRRESFTGTAARLSSDPAPLDPGGTLRSVETTLIRRALAETGGNVTAASRRLGISRSSIYRRLAEGADAQP